MQIDYPGPCMCGATDCPSCGLAQGYKVRKVWDYKRGGWKFVNPDPEDEDDEDPPLEPDEYPDED